MRHSCIRLFGSTAVSLFVWSAVFAAPHQEPSVPLVTKVHQAPLIKTVPFSYGKYVKYEPDAFHINPNLPDKAMDIPKGSVSRRDLLARAITGTGFTLEIDAKSQKILEQSPRIYFSPNRLTSAHIIDSVVRVMSRPDALDYSVNGKTIKVFPAAKDADGFTLRRISVDAKDAPLQDVLTDLLGQTGYRLFVPMHLNAKVTVECRDVTVGEAIRAVLAAAPGNLEFVRMASGGTGQTLSIQEAKQEVK